MVCSWGTKPRHASERVRVSSSEMVRLQNFPATQLSLRPCRSYIYGAHSDGCYAHTPRDAARGTEKERTVSARGSAEKKSPEMDCTRRRRSSPATASAAVPLLLLFPMFFWSQAAAYGAASGTGMTALQKHAAFFDSNNDGIVSFSETYEGFRALGFGIALSSLSAAFINGALGPKTRPENDTSHLSIYIENIHKGIHGSDSGAYDAEGRFVPEKFDEIFIKHAKTVPDALTSSEIDELLSANREPNDYTGWAGASTEWKFLYSLGKDKDGLLRKDAVRAVYDGSLFVKLAQERRSQENKA